MASIAGDRVIYGMTLPIQSLSRTLLEPWEPEATVEDLVAVARQADATGMDFVGVCDHVAIPDNEYAAHMSTTWYDTVATMGFLAAHTSRVRLLSAVYIPAYRHPLATAKAFGTLDHLSGGRVILGVGAGHVQAEFEALGVDFHARGRILDETLAAVRGAHAAPYVSFESEHFSYRDVGVAPVPAQGELPIWVGGNGAAAWRRVGRLGDGLIPMGNPPDQYPEILATIRAAAEKAGRGDATFDIGIMPPRIHVGDPTFDLGAWPHLTGSPESIAERLRAFLAVGANVLHLKFRCRTLEEQLDQMAAFGAEVAPLLR
jgi:probable F420-dependent oxidoreductase